MADEVTDLPSHGSATSIWSMAAFWFLMVSSNPLLKNRYINFTEQDFPANPENPLSRSPPPTAAPLTHTFAEHPLLDLQSSMMTSTFSLGQASIAVSVAGEDVEMEDVEDTEALPNPPSTPNAPQHTTTPPPQPLLKTFVDLRHVLRFPVTAYIIQQFILRLLLIFQEHAAIHRSIRLKLIRIYSVLLCLDFRGPWVSSSTSESLTDKGSFNLVNHAVFFGLKRLKPGWGRE